MNWIEILASHKPLILVIAALTIVLLAVLALWIRVLSRPERRHGQPPRRMETRAEHREPPSITQGRSRG